MLLTRDEESQVTVAQHRSYTDQTRATTRHDAHVLPCILRLPPLAMMLVVQLRNCFTERLNTSRGAVLATMARNVHLLGSLEAALDLIVDLRRTLAQVRPCIRLVEVAVLVSTFGGPYHTSGGARGVKSGVGLVSFVGVAKLSVDFGGELCRKVLLASVL
jgi:hypothetical protein